MPIEFRCTVCNQNLRVPEQHAGQQAKCPQCGHLATVPSVDAAASPAPAPGMGAAYELAAAPAPPRQESGTADRWRMKTRTGDTFGPVSRAELDHWLADGRIEAASQLQQEGWASWKSAGEIYPSLAPANNPYGAPGTAYVPGEYGQNYSYSYVKPHRGTMVLILGVLSVTMCPLTGIAAWIMGAADLKEIREGRMDKNGEGTTQAGYICGIIGTVLMLLQLGLVVLYILFIVVFVAAAGP